jgi:hypothetical protein
MRFIAHNWSDTKLKEILGHLRSSAQPSTKLIVVDHLIPHAAPPSGEFKDIPGAEERPVPKPLLPNLGIACSLPYIADMVVCFSLPANRRPIHYLVC